FLITNHSDKDGVLTFWFLIAGIVAGCFAFGFVISYLPSKLPEKIDTDAKPKRKRKASFLDSETSILLLTVFPLLMSAFLVTTAWAWNYKANGRLYDSDIFGWLRYYQGLEFFVIASAAAFVVALAIFLLINKGRGFNFWEAGSALLGSIIGGALLWLGVQRIFDPHAWSEALGPRFEPYEWQVFVCLAVPAFLLVVLVAATIYVGLSSFKSSDEDREW